MKDLFNGLTNEEHRHNCELNWLEKMPLQKRREYLILVEQKRSKKAREKLEKGLWDLWNSKK
jgi:hypothetical protein